MLILIASSHTVQFGVGVKVCLHGMHKSLPIDILDLWFSDLIHSTCVLHYTWCLIFHYCCTVPFRKVRTFSVQMQEVTEEEDLLHRLLNLFHLFQLSDPVRAVYLI